MAYIRFSEIKFPRKEFQAMCRNMLHDINVLEQQVMMDEEFVQYLASKNGVDMTGLKYTGTNHQVLYALKTAFWYYSGKDPSMVLMDQPTRSPQKEVNIFDPLS